MSRYQSDEAYRASVKAASAARRVRLRKAHLCFDCGDPASRYSQTVWYTRCRACLDIFNAKRRLVRRAAFFAQRRAA